MIAVSPWAAVLVTRFSSRAVLIGTQCVSAAVAMMMACCYVNGDLGLQLLAVGALCLGFAYALALPIQTALVPTLVGEADITSAVRMNSVSYNAGRALAPALSVVVIASLGPGLTFVLNAISFVIFALLLRQLSRIAQDTSLRTTLARACRAKRLAASPPTAARMGDLGHPDGGFPPVALPATPAATRTRSGPQSRPRVTDGLMIALRNRRILLLLAIVAAVTLVNDPVMVLSPALAHAKLHISNEWSGYFIAALGVGIGTWIGDAKLCRRPGGATCVPLRRTLTARPGRVSVRVHPRFFAVGQPHCGYRSGCCRAVRWNRRSERSPKAPEGPRREPYDRGQRRSAVGDRLGWHEAVCLPARRLAGQPHRHGQHKRVARGTGRGNCTVRASAAQKAEADHKFSRRVDYDRRETQISFRHSYFPAHKDPMATALWAIPSRTFFPGGVSLSLSRTSPAGVGRRNRSGQDGTR